MTEFYTVPEVAKMFRVCEQTVRNRVNEGKWQAWRDGRQIRFGPEDIEAIRAQGQKTPTNISKEDKRKRNKQLRNLPVFAQ